MYQSLQEGKAVSMKIKPTIASGLAPPYAGMFICYQVVEFLQLFKYVCLYFETVRSEIKAFI